MLHIFMFYITAINTTQTIGKSESLQNSLY